MSLNNQSCPTKYWLKKRFPSYYEYLCLFLRLLFAVVLTLGIEVHLHVSQHYSVSHVSERRKICYLYFVGHAPKRLNAMGSTAFVTFLFSVE